jgi:hypothetical protein
MVIGGMTDGKGNDGTYSGLASLNLTSRGGGWGKLPLLVPVLAGERRHPELARAGKLLVLRRWSAW